MSTQPYPVRLVGGDELQRSRLTVFFRLILLIPHAIALWLYGIAAFITVIIAWFAALFTGSVPTGMHDFITGYLKYYARVVAYGTILADPFPPFGSGGSYPVGLEIDPPVPQSRVTVLFRLILVLPCWVLANYALQPFLGLIAIGNWFVALFTGRVPEGMENAGMFCLRFIMRKHSYFFLVNPRYPAFGDTPGTLSANQSALPPIP